MEKHDQTISRQRTPQRYSAGACVDAIKRYLADFGRRAAFRAELAELDRNGYLDRMLDDLGLTRWEVNRIAKSYPEAERLLANMAYRHNILLQDLDARSLYALRHTCMLCSAHRICRRWLQHGENSDFKKFCPNAGTFEALSKPVATEATPSDDLRKMI